MRICHLPRSGLLAILLWLGGQGASHAQSRNVIATGAMRNTMFNGQLAGLLSLDTLARYGVYGLGPLEALRGELLVVDGHVFVSEVAKDGMVKVTENYSVRAPFFVHAHVQAWDTIPLPAAVNDLATLDAWLTRWADTRSEPFVFRIQTLVDSAQIHIMDLPSGTFINGPEEPHAFARSYALRHMDCELVGFFSSHHKGVFTHHDSNSHVHDHGGSPADGAFGDATLRRRAKAAAGRELGAFQGLYGTSPSFSKNDKGP